MPSIKLINNNIKKVVIYNHLEGACIMVHSSKFDISWNMVVTDDDPVSFITVCSTVCIGLSMEQMEGDSICAVVYSPRLPSLEFCLGISRSIVTTDDDLVKFISTVCSGTTSGIFVGMDVD